ncbi:NUDIX domain-containing protein [Streptomyces globisporus]|uniref:NUDIX domain-containing protein n=1 Tax=Streptomyces globisporus TaxID=1908 RepID=UPI0005C93C3A|nr:NUDIX domain-containing protein [Streptomyces globisporus]AWL89993.1 NUDIX domain-containing protein [Streptomyces globisporus]PPA43912.1 DNA mismatch repair protein MutT [Streptomyces griseus]RAN21143.1 DNA mismatch repair protein MutT [Streptomyces badius]RAN29081.1 DNA mismatch repair protein MutT [Streptomyces badius]
MSTGRRSAGLLLFRVTEDEDAGERDVEVLIGHMGGPFWAGREAAAWSVPKGEYGAEESAEAAARREFTEELGVPVPPGEWIALGEARQRSGKTVTVWALEAGLDLASVLPGTFTMEWPRGSGVQQEFPEMDRFAWCTPEQAAERLIAGQRVFVDRLRAQVRGAAASPDA